MSTRADRALEMETIIRWDRASDEATFYTSDPSEMRRWRALGYDVHVYGTTHEGKARGWQATVPIEAIALLPLRAGQVRAPRWLEPPTLAVKAQGRREPGKADENIEEIRADFSDGEQRIAG